MTREEAIKHIKMALAVPNRVGFALIDDKSLETVIEALDRQIIDAVEVVRYKECKYYEAPTIHNRKQCAWWTGDPYEQATTDPDDFCSYGERREDE